MSDIRLLSGTRWIHCTLWQEGKKHLIKFPYNEALKNEIKSMKGARWEPTEKVWSFENCARNNFQLSYLGGKNPYARYDLPLNLDFKTDRVELRDHQRLMTASALVRHYIIWAAEMGCIDGETELRCQVTDKEMKVKDWYKFVNDEGGELPYLKCYDSEGILRMEQPSRIFTKQVDHQIKITLENGFCVSVGCNHLFLTGFKGELCLVSAESLTTSHQLVIDKSPGIGNILIQLTQSKKLTILGCGTETVQSTSRAVCIEANYVLQTLTLLPNSVGILNVLKSQVMVRLSYLEKNGLKCHLNLKDNFLSLDQIYGDISFADCSMLTDQSVSIDLRIELIQVITSLCAMLHEIYLKLQQFCLEAKLSPDMEQIKFQSLVDIGFNSLQTHYTMVLHDFLNGKPQNSEKFLLEESKHLIPHSTVNLRGLKVIALEQLTEKKVYDLSIPKYGNYFDAQGINHQNTGKSLSAIELTEQSGFDDWWYVGPRSAIEAFRYELVKWRAKIIPMIFTYEELKKVIKDWPKGKKSPRGIILDESSKVKTPTAQRSQAAQQMADGIRDDWDESGFDLADLSHAHHGTKGYVVLMTGTPAPKSPLDWYNQAEIACPGFLKEGTYFKFRDRLAVVTKENSIAGGEYSSIKCWKDKEGICNTCGEPKEDLGHTVEAIAFGKTYHPYVPAKNEVELLKKRLEGLVLVIFKKDCLSLPEKQYRIIQLKPTTSILRAAKLIDANSRTAIQALTRLRELSDGFQYSEKEIGNEPCELCQGSKVLLQWSDSQGEPLCDPDTEEWKDNIQSGRYAQRPEACPNCNGTGEQVQYEREATEIPTPKEEAVANLLDLHDDIGRIVFYAGFTASIDRIVRICHKFQWSTIRVDGRGWDIRDYKDNPISAEEIGHTGVGTPALHLFQDDGNLIRFPQVAFIGHPGSAGMGLTLTKSPTICYYSNDFNAEYRIQSEDRIHRMGMDPNRGATIIDLFHLETDKYVLDNLKRKRDLQAVSLGDLRRYVKWEM